MLLLFSLKNIVTSVLQSAYNPCAVQTLLTTVSLITTCDIPHELLYVLTC